MVYFYCTCITVSVRHCWVHVRRTTLMHSLKHCVTTTPSQDLTRGTHPCCCVLRKASKENQTCCEAAVDIFPLVMMCRQVCRFGLLRRFISRCYMWCRMPCQHCYHSMLHCYVVQYCCQLMCYRFAQTACSFCCYLLSRCIPSNLLVQCAGSVCGSHDLSLIRSKYFGHWNGNHSNICWNPSVILCAILQ